MFCQQEVVSCEPETSVIQTHREPSLKKEHQILLHILLAMCCKSIVDMIVDLGSRNICQGCRSAQL